MVVFVIKRTRIFFLLFMKNISPHAQPKFLVELVGEESKLGYLSGRDQNVDVCLQKRCFIDYFDDVVIDVALFSHFSQQLRVKVFDDAKVHWNCFLDAGFETRCYCAPTEQTFTNDGFQEEWNALENNARGSVPENGWLPGEFDLCGFKPAVFDDFSECVSSELLYECDYPLVLAFEHCGHSQIELKRVEFYWDSLEDAEKEEVEMQPASSLSICTSKIPKLIDLEKENFAQVQKRFQAIRINT